MTVKKTLLIILVAFTVLFTFNLFLDNNVKALDGGLDTYAENGGKGL